MPNNYTIKGSASRGIAGATLGYFIGFAAVTLFAPLVGYISLTPVEKGLLLSISSLTGSLFRIPFAAWVDTTGGKKPIFILLLIAFIGMLGILFMLFTMTSEQIKTNLAVLLIFGAMAGCGIATFAPGIGQTSYWFPQKDQGRALGIYGGIGGLAPGIFVLLITTVLLKTIGLPNTYLLWTILLLVGLILYAIYGQNAWFFQLRSQGASAEEAEKIAKDKYKQEIFPRGTVLKSLSISAKVWQTWVLVFVYFFGFGGFLALTNWFKEFFNNYHEFSIAQAGAMTALYSIGAALARIFGGGVADKIGGKKSTNFALFVCLVGSLLLATNGILSINVIGLLCLTLGMGIVNAGVFKMLPAFVPQAIGGAAGWVGGLGALGGFVLPNITSRFLTRGLAVDVGYLQGFYVYTILIVLSIIAVNILPHKK